MNYQSQVENMMKNFEQIDKKPMKKMIKLTKKYGGVEEALYLNPSQIGHVYDVPEHEEYGRVVPRRTRIGCLTHNNGGFEVIETVEQVIKLIEQI
jgi:hypothetical protein